ncbi:MAG: hypothetical protein OEM97_07415 [Acidimicrobiia bacterium]|nr:hypothetical protein [Acidimicrobiia bacterium]
MLLVAALFTAVPGASAAVSANQPLVAGPVGQSSQLLGGIGGCPPVASPFQFDPASINEGVASTIIDVVSVVRETGGYTIDMTNCAPTDLPDQFPGAADFNEVLTVCKFLNANHVVRGPEHTIDFGANPLFDVGVVASGSAFLPDESISVSGSVIVMSLRCRINKIALDGTFIFEHPLAMGEVLDSVVYFAFEETTQEGEVTPVDPADPEYPDEEDIDFGAGGGCTFADDDGNTHETNIEAICDQEITQGCDTNNTTLYCPDDLVTRAQMASFLARALALTAGTGNRFSDDDGNTHEGNIEAIATAGITLGCDTSGTLYCPAAFVTRAQMASFLARALDLPLNANHGFSDVSGTHASAIGAVRDAGITLGCSTTDTTLYCPDESVRRDQMASFIARALGLAA